jgi:diguanylate cyclase (GGDEF)-like protein
LVGGLGNRLAFEALEKRLDHSACCQVVMADLAHFKRLNDSMGHAVGDICLRAVAQALLCELKPADGAAVFRYGGDEFVIVLPDPTGAGQGIGARLESAVEEAVRDYLGLGLRLDVGEALIPAEAPSLAAGLALADSRMYGLKRSRA